MVSRIREILSARQLTPTQFADTIGVARPIVSHILSGRNKPSMDVVQKITEAFPELSLSWLLKGIGPMEAQETASRAVDASAVVPVPRRGAAKASEVAPPGPSKAKTLADAVALGVRAPEASIETDATASPTKEAPSLPLFPTSATAPHSSGLTNSGLNGSTLATTNTMSATPEPAGSIPTAATSAAAASIAQPFAEPGKVIRRIVIFYHDGTFTDYQPEN